MKVLSKPFPCDALQFTGRDSWPSFAALADRFSPSLSDDESTLVLKTPGQTLQLGLSSWLLFDETSAWTETDANFHRLYKPATGNAKKTTKKAE